MKKGFSIIMVFVTVMTMLFSGVTFADDTNENAENKTKESNFTNLIVFARFLDEDEFIDNSYNLLEKLQIILITVHILMFRIIMKLRQGEVLR
jgi:LDH2 family malate/lactate/ureidoglycolate dehydrogenase